MHRCDICTCSVFFGYNMYNVWTYFVRILVGVAHYVKCVSIDMYIVYIYICVCVCAFVCLPACTRYLQLITQTEACVTCISNLHMLIA